MGCVSSKKCNNNPGYRKSAILASETSFTMNEVEALYVLFKELGSPTVNDVLINKEDFQLALFGNRRMQNLIADRVFNLFDLKHEGVIRFEEFVRSLSIFHPRTPEADKIAFAFKLYDPRNTGFIGRNELKEMLCATLEELDMLLSDNLIEAILDKTFSEADLKQDGRIDEAEWKEFVARNPSLIRNMTLHYLRELTTIFPSFLTNTQVEDSDLNTGKDAYSYSSDNAKCSSRHQTDQQVAYLVFSVVKS